MNKDLEELKLKHTETGLNVPLSSKIILKCDELKIDSNGISLNLDLPSLKNVKAIIINGIKFVNNFKKSTWLLKIKKVI